MTHFLRSWALLLGASALTLATACSKKEDAAPTTGGIAGTVDPAKAVTLVTATDASSKATAVTPNDDSGAFSIANLPAGTYTVSFATAAGYLALADRSVSVAAGQTNALGTIRVAAFVAGTVDGTISPAGSVDFVQLTAPGSTQGVTVQPDVLGYFRFASVQPGTYNVSFRVGSSYLAPAPRTVSVVGSANAPVGTVLVSTAGTTSAPLRGTVGWQADGNSYTSNSLTGNMFLDNGMPASLTLTATSLAGTTADILTLYFDSRNTGLSLLGGNDGTASYLRTFGGVPGTRFDTANSGSNAGTVTITAFDATARTLSGTFGFTAYNQFRTASQIVSGGSFSLSY